MKKKVSVIVPTYNNEGTIAATIASIQAQTYSNIDIILVDDGSTDQTGEICDKFALKDERIKVIHQENKGICGARNAGMDSAITEYICFVDGDDEIEPIYVERLLSSMIECECDFVIGGITFYEGKKTYCCCQAKKEICLDTLTFEEWMNLYNEWIMIPAWNKLFSKRIIEENNLRWLDGIPCGEDGIFVFDYLKYCDKITIISEPIYRYYIFRTNASKRFWPLYGQIKMFELKKTLLTLRYKGDVCDIEQYCAKKALHNIRDRICYLVKKNNPDFNELKVCYDYYWPYVNHFLDRQSYFSESDWEWLCENKAAIVDCKLKNLYSLAEKEYRPEVKRRISRKIKRIMKRV